jgi:predicted molibdopterin-dependent oxidoreductase YjgC
VFGAGGGTSSYREIEETDCIVLWGSNAREAHPIFFHHLMKGVRNGAKMFSVDPRRTSSAQWADLWLGLDVGTDIALANAVGREIIHAGLQNQEFIDNATTGFEEYAASVELYTLEFASAITKVPPDAIRELAHGYAGADTAQLMWTLGITEHHNATDNVFALCNLALLTGHIGRWGSGLVPLRGQNNVQGGGDMGALPNKLPGFHDVTNADSRALFEEAWGVPVPPEPGIHLSLMFEAMERSELKACWVIGENPAESEAEVARARQLLSDLDILVVQDIFMTRTAELADVVLPAAAAWAETEGTVTNSERRVQRVRKALDPPGEARDDLDVIVEMAKRMGHEWTQTTTEDFWNELRSVSPAHKGMSYERLEDEGGLQWPCPSVEHPGSPFLHGRLWEDSVEVRSPFTPVVHQFPKEALTEDYPLRLTTGRVLDSYNTGVQSSGYNSPIRSGHTLDMSPQDAARLALTSGDKAQVTTRRGSLVMEIRIVPEMREGLVFTTFHFPDEVDINLLTNEAWDPKSGTSEFKAAAVRVEKLGAAQMTEAEA